MDDFDAAILQAGFDVDNFRVVDLEDEPTTKEQYAITGTVTVLRISTGDTRKYGSDRLLLTPLGRAFVRACIAPEIDADVISNQ